MLIEMKILLKFLNIKYDFFLYNILMILMLLLLYLLCGFEFLLKIYVNVLLCYFVLLM